MLIISNLKQFLDDLWNLSLVRIDMYQSFETLNRTLYYNKEKAYNASLDPQKVGFRENLPLQ